MPLALLQFYGKPATLQRTIGEQSIRVSFGNLVLVAIGSVISPWERHADDFDAVCQFFDALGKSLKRSDPEGKVTFGWHELFGQQAATYLRAEGQEKQYFRRLINLGRRRFAAFMSPEPNLAPGYGLCSLDISLASLHRDDQIKTIREMANNHDLGIDLRGGFIVYRHSDNDRTYYVEIASIFPIQFGNEKKIHRRWTCPRPVGWAQARKSGEQLLYMNNSRGFAFNFEMGNGYVFDSEGTVQRSMDLFAHTRELCGLLPEYAFENPGGQTTMWPEEKDIYWRENEAKLDLGYLESLARDHSDIRLQGPPRQLRSWKIAAKQHHYQGVKYVQIFSTSEIKVYQPIDLSSTKDIVMPLDYLAKRISSGSLDKHLRNYFDLPSLRVERVVHELHPKSQRHHVKENIQNTRQLAPQLHSLFALYKASLIYSKLLNADVDLAVASKPLNEALWAQIEERPVISSIQRPEAFACVTMFDTGHVNLDPADFKDVIAISSGDTLYVSEMLLNDPCQPPMEFGIRCLIGNIGRPGVALLMGPKDPILLEDDLNTWSMVNHSKFDDKLENNFKSTSLQLSLTGYEQVVNIPTTQGRRYKEVAYVEAVVSAYDCGAWVGDLDILGLYNDTFDTIYDDKSEGSHIGRALPISCSHGEVERADASKFGNLTSIDNWSEFLDPPPNTAIIRANGNWIARLAFAAAMRCRGDAAVWAPGRICWRCVEKVSKSFERSNEEILILC